MQTRSKKLLKFDSAATSKKCEANGEKENKSSKNISNRPTSNDNEVVPIWKKSPTVGSPMKGFKVKRTSRRLSKLKNETIYEFLCEETDNAKKKKRRKPVVKKKCSKPIAKSKILTTDPSFKPLITKIHIAPKEFYKRTPNKSNFSKQPSPSLSSYHGSVDTLNNSEIQSNNFDDFESETCSFSTSNTKTPRSQPEVSLPSILESPIVKFNSNSVDDTNSHFVEKSSTPINMKSPKKKSHKKLFQSAQIASVDEIKLCFGFDESDTDFGLSPVKPPNLFRSYHRDKENLPIPTRCNIEPQNLHTQLSAHPKNVSTDTTGPSISNIRGILTVANVNTRKRNKRNLAFDKTQKPMELESNIFEKKAKVKESNIFEKKAKVKESNIFENKAKIKKQKKSAKVLSTPTKTQQTLETSSEKLTLIFSPSPKKDFKKEIRRSYDRKSLEMVRRNFEREHGGRTPNYNENTENESECEESTKRQLRRTRRLKTSKASAENSAKNVEVSKPQAERDRTVKVKSKKHAKAATDKSKVNHERTLKSKKNDKTTGKLDKSLIDWASDMNSQFSEIEDFELVCE